MQSSQNYEKDTHKRLKSQESPSEKTSQKRLCDGIQANNHVKEDIIEQSKDMHGNGKESDTKDEELPNCSEQITD